MIEFTPSPPAAGDEPVASRRDFVAAAVTVAAAVGAVAPAQAQPAPTVRHTNPQGMSAPPTYSQVVEVNGPHRVVYLAGQTGQDASGKIAQGIHDQAVQVMENIKTALASVGGSMDNVVRLVTYLTDIEENADAYREVRASFFGNKSALPASTLLQITRLANPSFFIEVDATAILPPRA